MAPVLLRLLGEALKQLFCRLCRPSYAHKPRAMRSMLTARCTLWLIGTIRLQRAGAKRCPETELEGSIVQLVWCDERMLIV